MSRSITLYLIFALLVLFTVACSGGKGDPVTPDMGYQEPVKEVKGAKVVAGVWHIVIDKATGTADIADMRNSKLILNVLGFMEPPVLSGVSIDLPSLVIDPPIVEIDVILTHPIPDPVFMGFDVRGVVFGPEVKNADGLTILTGPEYFKSTPFGYIDGLLGAPDSYANYEGLFGYKYFADGLSYNADLATFFSNPTNLAKRGVFREAPNKNRRHYVLDWTDSDLDFFVFNYAMYVNYDWPTSSGSPSGPDDFDINKANSAEAFCCRVTETANNLWYSGGMGGGAISLDVEAWDWQGDIADVTIKSVGAGISEASYTMDAGQGSTSYSYYYEFTDIPGEPTGAGEQEILITVVDTKTFGGYWFMNLLPSGNPMYNDRVYNCFLHKTTVTEAPPVYVYTVSPDIAETSTYLPDVTITGDNFSDPALVKLKLDAAPDIDATNVVVWDLSTLTCDIFVPFDAAPGFYDVEVTAGTGVAGVGEALFEVFEILPIVDTIEPSVGETSSYIPDVIITGGNFIGPGAQIKLRMGAEPDIEATNVQVMDVSTVMCDIAIPWGATVGFWDVEVTNGTGKSGTGPSLFEIIDLSPVILLIDPNTGETGTDLFDVTIAGQNFEGPNAQVKLKMDPEPDIVATNVVVVDINTITCDISIPIDAAIGRYDVEVTNFDGLYGIREDLFEVYTTNPLVIGVEPNNGETGTDVLDIHVMGDNFEGPASQVIFKMAAAPDIAATNVVVVDQHTMTCDLSIPSDAPIGLYDIAVTNNSGKTGTGQEMFEVWETVPIVLVIDPNIGGQGEDLVGVSVMGNNFEGPGAQVLLKLAGEPDIAGTNVVVVDAHLITCDISIPPTAMQGLYDIEVINGDGKSGTGVELFTVMGPPPEVTGINPANAEPDTNLAGVTISGDYFVGPIVFVTLKATPPEPDIPTTNTVVVDSNTITCDISILPAAWIGLYDVEVRNGDGQVGLGEDLFEVLCPTPIITSILPDHGNQGDTHLLMTIEGNNFVGALEDADVRLLMSGFPDIVGEILDYTPTQVVVNFDLTSAELGAWDVQVTNGCGGIGVETGGFTVE